MDFRDSHTVPMPPSEINTVFILPWWPQSVGVMTLPHSSFSLTQRQPCHLPWHRSFSCPLRTWWRGSSQFWLFFICFGLYDMWFLDTIWPEENRVGVLFLLYSYFTCLIYLLCKLWKLWSNLHFNHPFQFLDWGRDCVNTIKLKIFHTYCS